MNTNSSKLTDSNNLTFYNSLYRERQAFTPLEKGKVKIYSCGPTVYDYPHIGNYRSFLFSDLLHRVFKLLGYQVTLVMNLTDIDDKTIKNSQQKNQSLTKYTEPYIKAFFDDLKLLHVLPATHYPKATNHISEMEDMIDSLIKKEHAYYSDDSIYFKLSSFSDYGKLSNIKIEEQQAGASSRVLEDEYERDEISDFVLWKKYQASDGSVYYDSKLGKGRPGWHIECSAMSKKYLGAHFDIHTGGMDNRFPHHENEIAQSVCANNHDYVNYWLHVSHLFVDGQKMSKSLGNFFTLRDLKEKELHPTILRYMLISTHYRNHYNFRLEDYRGAFKTIERVERFFHNLIKAQETDKSNKNTNNEEGRLIEIKNLIQNKRAQFILALKDDLNVSVALASLFEFINECYRLSNDFKHISNDLIHEVKQFLDEANSVFACFDFTLDNPKNIPSEVQTLFDQRQQARSNKDFSTADRLRQEINNLGYQVIDGNPSYLEKLH